MRKSISKIALAAVIALFFSFTFSCSSGGDGGLYSPESISSSSENEVFSSSSVVPSSSSATVVAPGKDNNISNYRTVTIGTQVWMAENLDYNVSGSKCYNDDPANCTIYGRLYDWATAMNLPSNCNSSTCSGQIQPQHQGICPSGWHIPSSADWGKLLKFVDNANEGSGEEISCGTATCYNSSTAGEYLRAASGFSALPGGYGYSGGDFHNIGDNGLWWSASEYDAYLAYILLLYGIEYAHWISYVKGNLFSVRCVQDSPDTPSSSSVPPQSEITYGSSVTYDGETYQTVVIGTQTWFKRNLNYNASGSKCYDNLESNCATYGRLYNWATAMALDASCNSSTCSGQVNANHRGICPSGWHIPSNADWDKLYRYVDGGTGTSSPYAYESSTAGTKLKSTSGWNSYSGIPAVTDTYGFSALPGGGGSSDGSFSSVGDGGVWWSSTEDGGNYTYIRRMDYINDGAYWGSIDKNIMFSVRCLKD